MLSKSFSCKIFQSFSPNSETFLYTVKKKSFSYSYSSGFLASFCHCKRAFSFSGHPPLLSTRRRKRRRKRAAMCAVAQRGPYPIPLSSPPLFLLFLPSSSLNQKTHSCVREKEPDCTKNSKKPHFRTDTVSPTKSTIFRTKRHLRRLSLAKCAGWVALRLSPRPVASRWPGENSRARKGGRGNAKE